MTFKYIRTRSRPASGFDATIFRKDLDVVRSTLGASLREPLPIGVGYIGWKLDETNTELLTLALENRVMAV